jgi:hypothetical protein
MKTFQANKISTFLPFLRSFRRVRNKGVNQEKRCRKQKGDASQGRRRGYPRFMVQEDHRMIALGQA